MINLPKDAKIIREEIFKGIIYTYYTVNDGVLKCVSEELPKW